MKKLLLLFLLLFSLYGFNQEVIAIDGSNCDVHGTASVNSRVYNLNEYKNRYAFPKGSDFDENITFEDVMQSADPNQFSQDRAISLSGYVFNVKLGGIESCNCKTKNPAFRDTHIELVPDAAKTGPQYRVIVEVTPRLRAIMARKGVDWSTGGLRNSIKGHWVKIEGWLLYDAEHESGAFANDPDDQIGSKNWRATCWEIHPVTSIEVSNANDVTRNNKEHKRSSYNKRKENKTQPANYVQQGNSSFKFILLGLVGVIIIVVLLFYFNSKR